MATAPFITPPNFQLPILLIDEITLPPHSEKWIDVKVLSRMDNITEALFEPAQNLYSKQILLANELIRPRAKTYLQTVY